MPCKICNSDTIKIFEKKVLNKYQSNYYQCTLCDFVQTDSPIWLEESYTDAITSLDLGLLNRNNRLQKDVSKIIDCVFPKANAFIDYAGGYGIFVRLMRDAGFNFYRQDPYCENIFAKGFDIEDSKLSKFDILTGFEVFEHFENPITELEKMFSYADSIIVSTELLPENKNEIEDWWYISPEIGQHIAFYSKKTMQFIANKFQKRYYYINPHTHLFTPVVLSQNQEEYLCIKQNTDNRILAKFKKKPNFSVNRTSLLWTDYLLTKEKLFK